MRKSPSTPSDLRQAVTTLKARSVSRRLAMFQRLPVVDWLMLGGLVGLTAWMAGTLWR